MTGVYIKTVFFQKRPDLALFSKSIMVMYDGNIFLLHTTAGFFPNGIHCKEEDIKGNLQRFFPELNQEGLQRNALVVPSATISTSNK